MASGDVVLNVPLRCVRVSDSNDTPSSELGLASPEHWSAVLSGALPESAPCVYDSVDVVVTGMRYHSSTGRLVRPINGSVNGTPQYQVTITEI